MDVSFELERFEWTPDDQLLVVGRWIGVHGRRVAKPLLTVEAGGRRHRVRGEATGLDADDQWHATFEWSGGRGDVPGAELEVGSVVVELPAPRRRRRRTGAVSAEGALRAQVTELQATVAELRAELAAQPEAEIEQARNGHADDDELAGLRLAHGSLRAAHEQLEDELEELRAIRDERDAAVAEAERLRSAAADEARVKADLDGVIQELQARAAEAESTRDRLTAELVEARAEIERLQAELDDARTRIDSERATTTQVHSRLATAREEAHKTIAAEAQETERLRTELQTSREDAERALATERAEVARLREELVDVRTGTEDGEAPRRELERVSRDLERERAATRMLRRELEELRSQTAEQRREVSNGTIAMRTPEGTQRRVEAARAASTHRVPQHAPSQTGQWAVRVGAAALIAVMIVALVFLVTLVL
jgi:chromosome segregation ATPase